MGADLVCDLGREPRTAVEHGQQHGAQPEVAVEFALDQVDGAHQLGDALERVVLALDRNQDFAGGDQCVERQQAE